MPQHICAEASWGKLYELARFSSIYNAFDGILSISETIWARRWSALINMTSKFETRSLKIKILDSRVATIYLTCLNTFHLLIIQTISTDALKLRKRRISPALHDKPLLFLLCFCSILFLFASYPLPMKQFPRTISNCFSSAKKTLKKFLKLSDSQATQASSREQLPQSSSTSRAHRPYSQ